MMRMIWKEYRVAANHYYRLKKGFCSTSPLSTMSFHLARLSATSNLYFGQIITEEFEELFKDYPLYSQEHEEDPLVICKLFDPCDSASWWITEYDPEQKLGFGYVTGLVADLC